MKDVGDVILKELRFVREETERKVKKLQLATDLHIGESAQRLCCCD